MAPGNGTEDNAFENNLSRRVFFQLFEIGFEEICLTQAFFLKIAFSCKQPIP